MVRFLVLLIGVGVSLMTSCSHGVGVDPDSCFTVNAQVKTSHKPLIILDPGHGGFDLGATVKSIQEKTLALKTAILVKKYLYQKGYRVILTRSRDVFVPLPQRAYIANHAKAHLFISIHYNAFKNPQAKGIEVYYYHQGPLERQKASKKLAKLALDRMIASTRANNRGVKAGNFHVIRETNMPAILIEGGFLTNPQEHAHLSDQGYLVKIAQSITQAVERYTEVNSGK